MLYIGPVRSKVEDHLAAHSQEHVDMLARAPYLLSQTELNTFFKQFRDVYICRESEQAARFAAGGAIECAKAVLDGRVLNAFALIR